MFQKTIKYRAKSIRLWPVMGLVFLLPLLFGCPPTYSCYVYYDGNRNTEGFAPVDSKVYFPGDMAIILAKPADLKKGTLEFLGWRQPGNSVPLQPGETISIDYENIWLYAWWGDDPDNYPYAYEDYPAGGVTITKYFGYDSYVSSIIIPNELDDKPVAAIGEGAFADAYLSEIVLPSQLEVIGNKAFSRNWIERIDIPDTVKSIGKLAFQNCSLNNINWGTGLESIDDYAFEENFLTALFLPANIKTLGAGAFYGNELTFIEIGANVTIKSKTSLGTYGDSFGTHYQREGSRAGLYLYKSGAWSGPYAK